MKKLYLIILFLNVQNIHSSNPLEKKGEKEQVEQVLPFATHGLMIILDDSETRIGDFEGAVSEGTLTALYQKASPILVSAHILNTLFIKYGNLKQLAAHVKVRKDVYQNWADYLDLIRQKLQEILEKNPSPSNEDYAHILDILNKIKSDHLVWADQLFASKLVTIVDFKEAEWDIYWVGNHLVLLIPKNFKPAFILPQKYQADAIAKELISGFRLNSLTTSNNLLKELENVKPQKDRSYFIESLNKLFVDGVEYKKRGFSLDAMPRWALYLNGHGLPNVLSAGLSLAQFKFFLDWLQQKIVTRLLAYDTCYASGINFEKVYSDQLKNEIAYSFAIAFRGISETEAIYIEPDIFMQGALTQSDIDFINKKLKFKTAYRFDQFFKIVMGNETIDFEKTFNLIFPKKESARLKSIYQMKLPGTRWFNVVDGDSSIVSIGNILTLTQERPLDVLNYALKRNKQADPRFILLYTPIIPFELIVNTPHEIKFISMIPGKVFHRFEGGIHSTRFTIDEILYQFWPDLTFQGEKVYFIKKITGKVSPIEIRPLVTDEILKLPASEQRERIKKSVITKDETIITNVLIKTEKNFNTIYAMIDGKSYEFRNLQFHEIENYADVISAIEKEFGKEVIEAFEASKLGIKKISEVQLKKTREIEANKKTEKTK